MPVVMMGVSGSGKTTIGSLLAVRLGVRFVDADALHPRENIEKMASGVPLDDDDRWPWLARVADEIAEHPEGVVVACSALKMAYRDALRRGGAAVLFAHLAPSVQVLSARLGARPGHFMPPSLLRSQLETLDQLGPEEWGITLDASVSPTAIVDAIEDTVAR